MSAGPVDHATTRSEHIRRRCSMRWLEHVKGDPISRLLRNAGTPVRVRTYQELLGERERAEALRRTLPVCAESEEVFSRQLPSGGWLREGDLYHRNGPQYGFGAIQQLDRLADYGLTVEEPRVRRAVEYVMGFRTPDGRFFWKRAEVARGRGEYRCWTAMFYEGYTVRALLCLGVPEEDLASNLERIRALQQDDGSWALRYGVSGRPLHRRGTAADDLLDRVWATTSALYALLASPSHRESETVRRGTRYLLDRLFDPVVEPRPGAGWWYYCLRYPDFYASLLRSLEAATRARFTVQDPRVRAGVDWLLTRQSEDGMWRTRFAMPRSLTGYDHIVPNHDWITLRALLVIKRACSEEDAHAQSTRC